MTIPLSIRPWPRCTTPGCRGYAAKSGICPPCGKRGTAKPTPWRDIYALRGAFWRNNG